MRPMTAEETNTVSNLLEEGKIVGVGWATFLLEVWKTELHTALTIQAFAHDVSRTEAEKEIVHTTRVKLLRPILQEYPPSRAIEEATHSLPVETRWIEKPNDIVNSSSENR